MQLQLLLLFFALEAPELEQPIRAWREGQLVQAVDGHSSNRPAVGWKKKIKNSVTVVDPNGTNRIHDKVSLTCPIIAIATAVQARLQIVDVNAARWGANDSKVATGSDVNGLWMQTGS